MKALHFSPAAECDIDEIWNYSADNWDADQADRYTDAIRDTCLALAAGRKRGRAADIRPGYLKLAVGSHMIYFKENGDRMEIIRILHGKQDVERRLQQGLDTRF